MGGLGALALYLKHRNLFISCSAFAPISNPTNAPWGHTAFDGYLKGGVEEGKEYDPSELIQTTDRAGVHILIDYGDADNFYKQKQLLPENFVEAASKAGIPQSEVTVRRQPGYDHSYYFVCIPFPAIVNISDSGADLYVWPRAHQVACQIPQSLTVRTGTNYVTSISVAQ